MRCFVAVEIPHTLRESLRTLQARLRKTIDGARWVRPEGIHLTLRFLGEIDETMLATIGEALGEPVKRAGPPFSLLVSGIGYFPPQGRPRVMWVGLGNPVDDGGALARMGTLQSSIEDAVRRAGMSPETKPFRPHLTLARFDDRKAPKPPKDPGMGVDLGALPIERVRLYRSLLKSTGAEYEVLKEYPL